jgi:hypothetical protein
MPIAGHSIYTRPSKVLKTPRKSPRPSKAPKATGKSPWPSFLRKPESSLLIMCWTPDACPGPQSGVRLRHETGNFAGASFKKKIKTRQGQENKFHKLSLVVQVVYRPAIALRILGGFMRTLGQLDNAELSRWHELAATGRWQCKP